MYTFCALEGSNPSPIADWVNISLMGKGYEQNVHTWINAALALTSKQLHPLTTAHAVNIVQFKMIGMDPYMAMVCLHVSLFQL